MIRKLKKWLQENDNNKAQLAFMIGLKQTVSIDKWIKTGKVSDSFKQALKEVFEKRIAIKTIKRKTKNELPTKNNIRKDQRKRADNGLRS
jgi:hypothetical protein